MLLLPVESAFFPFIDKADGQNAEERYHRPEAEQADIAERYSPWKQEGDFEVENDEQQRHEIKPHVEFITGIAERVEAAFISGIFIGVRFLTRDENRAEDHRPGHAEGDYHKDENWQIFEQ